jgi:hypothetical protein
MLACLLSLSFLTACEKPTVNVSLHGVNYSDATFFYAVADPQTPEKPAGGETIDPFGAGGTTCCAVLPRQWRPGLKLLVRTSYWTEDRVTKKISEFKDKQTVEVPQYLDGKPGELWVLREADGKISVISSDFQPDHPKWPGKVKGWPVPTLEYQRERWEIYRAYEEDGVKLYQNFLDELEKEPLVRAKEAWEYSKQNHPSEIREYTGPDDPRYIDFLREHYKSGLGRSKQLLNRVMEERP